MDKGVHANLFIPRREHAQFRDLHRVKPARPVDPHDTGLGLAYVMATPAATLVPHLNIHYSALQFTRLLLAFLEKLPK